MTSVVSLIVCGAVCYAVGCFIGQKESARVLEQMLPTLQKTNEEIHTLIETIEETVFKGLDTSISCMKSGSDIARSVHSTLESMNEAIRFLAKEVEDLKGREE